jgi:hypothetical protein
VDVQRTFILTSVIILYYIILYKACRCLFKKTLGGWVMFAVELHVLVNIINNGFVPLLQFLLSQLYINWYASSFTHSFKTSFWIQIPNVGAFERLAAGVAAMQAETECLSLWGTSVLRVLWVSNLLFIGFECEIQSDGGWVEWKETTYVAGMATFNKKQHL